MEEHRDPLTSLMSPPCRREFLIVIAFWCIFYLSSTSAGLFSDKTCFEHIWNEGDSSWYNYNEDSCLYFHFTLWCSFNYSPAIWQQSTRQYIFHLLKPTSLASRHSHTSEELNTLELETAENTCVSKWHKPNLFFGASKDLLFFLQEWKIVSGILWLWPNWPVLQRSTASPRTERKQEHSAEPIIPSAWPA